MEHRETILRTYSAQAAALSAQYNSLTTDKVFPHLPGNLPRLKALDVGCGNGRDAKWLAEQGYIVHAVDGAPDMLNEARKVNAHERVTLGFDMLPELVNTRAKGEKYDLILLSAVWMHIHPTRRAEALNNLMSLANPGALMLMSLRHGPAPADRPMFDVSPEELQQLSAERLMNFEHIRAKSDDKLGRSNVWWEDVYLRLPADHAEGLHSIRHNVLNSRMNSPHKPVLILALNRALQSNNVNYLDAATLALPAQAVISQWQKLYGGTDARALGIAASDRPSRVLRTLTGGPLAHITESLSGAPLFTLRRDADGAPWLTLPRPVGDAMRGHSALVSAGAVAAVDRFLAQRETITPDQAKVFRQQLLAA